MMSDLEQFRSLGVSEEILEALRVKGFETPSPIQELTIPKLLAGENDLIGQAQTGTGKTAAFGIPIIQRCEPGWDKPQALILAPTRELSIQIAEELNSLKGRSRLRIAPFYGGQAIEIQLQKLRDGIDVVIGTPGRLLDLMRRGKFDFSELKFAVLDEADEMLDMGFLEEIEGILAATTTEKRMLMFSATMPPAILKIAERFMRGYEVVRTLAEQPGTALTEQIWFEVRREDKFDALSRIIDMEDGIYALIFCRTRNDSDELVERLKQRGFRAEVLHGDIAQAQRTKVINQFKEKRFRLLVATDVAARGIDVNDLTHVINYSIPQESETYIHRIGRTGRAGKTGMAITFVTPGEARRLAYIRHETGMRIEKRELPGGREIVERKKQCFSELLTETISGGKHRGCLGFAEELTKLAESPAEVLAAILHLRFQDELRPENYNDFGAKKRDRNSWESASDDRDAARLYVGVGKLDGYGAVKMLDLLWERARLRKSRVGKIDCFDHFSFVNVDPEVAEQVLEAFRRGGPTVRVATERPDGDAPAAERPERPERPARRSYNDGPAAERPERPARRTYNDGPAAERPERAPRKPRAESPAAAPEAEKTAKPPIPEGLRKPKTTAAEKKRRLGNWVEKISADIELKEKRAARKRK